MRVPSVRALFFKQRRDAIQHRLIVQNLAILFIHKQRDGHTPDALAADTPIEARFNHTANAVLADGGKPRRRVDSIQGQLTQRLARLANLHLVQRDKPLRCRAEDERRL